MLYLFASTTLLGEVKNIHFFHPCSRLLKCIILISASFYRSNILEKNKGRIVYLLCLRQILKIKTEQNGFAKDSVFPWSSTDFNWHRKKTEEPIFKLCGVPSNKLQFSITCLIRKVQQFSTSVKFFELFSLNTWHFSPPHFSLRNLILETLIS